MTISTGKPFILVVLLVGLLPCVHMILKNEDLNQINSLSSLETVVPEQNEDLDQIDLLSSLTTNILDLLEHLKGSHGTTLRVILGMLLDRVQKHNVTETEANAIREAIGDLDDPQTLQILEIIDGVVSSMSMDELLSSAFNVVDEDDLTKSVGGLPEIEFLGDNRTYVISQLDMLIPKEEMERGRRAKRKAVINEERLLWKNAIVPYRIYEDHFTLLVDKEDVRLSKNHGLLFRTNGIFYELTPKDVPEVPKPNNPL